MMPLEPPRAPIRRLPRNISRTNYKAFSGIEPSNPAADRAYDAGAIVGLAIAQAGKAESAAIKEAIPKVLDPKGEVIHAGKEEFAKALELIKEGKPIKYEGVIGPVSLRSIWRHHRPLPAVAHPEWRSHNRRRDVDSRRRRHQGQDRQLTSASLPKPQTLLHSVCYRCRHDLRAAQGSAGLRA